MNKTYPKISIVTPSFNQGNYIEKTILSVLEQNYPNLEYIIIDGGSTDQTIDIIKKYESQITYWVSEPDKGQSHAINKGIQKCTGDIFNWLNSDDYLEPNALFKIADEWSKKQFTCLCAQTNVIDDIVFSHVRKPSYLGESIENTICNFSINQEGTWWSLDSVKKLQGVNQDFDYTMDLDLWFRALLTFDYSGFVSSDLIVSNFRRHSNAKSTINNEKKYFDSGFFNEHIYIFSNMCRDKMLAEDDLFLCFNFPRNKEKLSDLSYNISLDMQSQILELYLFNNLKKSFYIKEYKVSKRCIKLMRKYNFVNFKKDISYFRRKLFLKLQ